MDTFHTLGLGRPRLQHSHVRVFPGRLCSNTICMASHKPAEYLHKRLSEKHILPTAFEAEEQELHLLIVSIHVEKLFKHRLPNRRFSSIEHYLAPFQPSFFVPWIVLRTIIIIDRTRANVWTDSQFHKQQERKHMHWLMHCCTCIANAIEFKALENFLPRRHASAIRRCCQRLSQLLAIFTSCSIGQFMNGIPRLPDAIVVEAPTETANGCDSSQRQAAQSKPVRRLHSEPLKTPQQLHDNKLTKNQQQKPFRCLCDQNYGVCTS
eukprot:SAG31_NODE_990_length_10529_cov_37.528340_3_plen_265_part_00